VATDGRGVRTLTLARPETRNALDGALISALTEECERATAAPEVRVVVLTGAGSAFCAGADLRWLRAGPAASSPATSGAAAAVPSGGGVDLAVVESGFLDAAAALGALMEALWRLDRPLIARVNGPARGGGVGLVCCCDIAVAVAAADFAFTEVRLGLIPAVISPYVVEALGARQARRYLLGGEIMDSAAALALGLVHEVVPQADLDRAVARHIENLLAGGPTALAETKALLRRIGGEGHGEGGGDSSNEGGSEGHHGAGVGMVSLAERCRWLRQRLTGPEAWEGIAAFLERRPPRW
jgi:methylglutaconyl-CoA hydratase